MKQYALHIVIALLACMLSGCVKNEFRISFGLAPAVNAPVRAVYYASDPAKGWIVETVADVKQGKGIIDGATRMPTFVFLFAPGATTPGAVLYAERGDSFNISGDGQDPSAWDIEGNDLTESLSEWRISNRKAIAAGDTEAVNRAVATEVKAHPDSPLSLVLLTLYFSRRDDEATFLSLRKLLTPEALADEELDRALSCADIPDGLLTPPGQFRTFACLDIDGDPDTLSLKGRRGALLAFRDVSCSLAEAPAHDSIRALLKEFPDADPRLIADLCLDADSIGWIRSSRIDTIPGITRGWLPHALADSTAMHLGVRRLPFYIVFDRTGRQTYRGDNISKASAAFRKAVK